MTIHAPILKSQWMTKENKTVKMNVVPNVEMGFLMKERNVMETKSIVFQDVRSRKAINVLQDKMVIMLQDLFIVSLIVVMGIRLSKRLVIQIRLQLLRLELLMFVMNAEKYWTAGSVRIMNLVYQIVINVETIMLMEESNVTMETENLEMDVIANVMLRLQSLMKDSNGLVHKIKMVLPLIFLAIRSMTEKSSELFIAN